MQTTINISSKSLCEIEYCCPVCGCSQYESDPASWGDAGDHIDSGLHRGIALHCASAAAKFWLFPRRSPEELVAKWHWDQSQIIPHSFPGEKRNE